MPISSKKIFRSIVDFYPIISFGAFLIYAAFKFVLFKTPLGEWTDQALKLSLCFVAIISLDIFISQKAGLLSHLNAILLQVEWIIKALGLLVLLISIPSFLLYGCAYVTTGGGLSSFGH